LFNDHSQKPIEMEITEFVNMMFRLMVFWINWVTLIFYIKMIFFFIRELGKSGDIRPTRTKVLLFAFISVLMISNMIENLIVPIILIMYWSNDNFNFPEDNEYYWMRITFNVCR